MSKTGGYCQARQRLTLSRLQQSHGTHRPSRREALSPRRRLWRGREVKVVDGSTATLPDTSANQKVFPQQLSCKSPAAGFPIMRLRRPVFPWPLARLPGRRGDRQLLRRRIGALFRKLWHFLKPRDVLLADRHFSDYGTLAALWELGRCRRGHAHESATPQWIFRQASMLGPGDRLITWEKTCPTHPHREPPTLKASLPEILTSCA